MKTEPRRKELDGLKGSFSGPWQSPHSRDGEAGSPVSCYHLWEVRALQGASRSCSPASAGEQLARGSLGCKGDSLRDEQVGQGGL